MHKTSGDTLKDERVENWDSGYDKQLLQEAQDAYNRLYKFRMRRKRTTRFIYEDQLGDMVVGKDGKATTLRDSLEKQLGGPASQDNHMIKIENAMEGLYAKGQGMPTCFATCDEANVKSTQLNGLLQDNYDLNNLKEVLANEWMESLRGGLPVVTTEWRCENSVEDVYTYPINPDFFFFSSRGNDPRMWDVSLVGEIRDYLPIDLAVELSSHGGNCKRIYDWIMTIYPVRNGNSQTHFTTEQTDINKYNDWDRTPEGYCRTYHVWKKQGKIRYRCVDILDAKHPLYKIDVEDLPKVKAINAQRLIEGAAMGLAPEEVTLIEYEQRWDVYWHFTMLDPHGRILIEYDSPYDHESHPYTFVANKFVDGDIFPFMSLWIDQQKFINDLVMMKKLMVNKSIKGLKMVPTTLLNGMSPKEFAEMSLEIGEYLFYTPDPKTPNLKPEIINASIDVKGVDQMLEMEIRNISELSNVNDSVRGKSPSAGTPYSSYALQSENATTSLVSGLNTFNMFETELAKKILKTQLQYYTEPRYISNGRTGSLQQMMMVDPQEVRDVPYYVKVRSSAESPVARMALNSIAAQLKAEGDLDAEGMMEASYFPGKEVIMQALQNTLERRRQMVSGPEGTVQDPRQLQDAMEAMGAAESIGTPPARYPTLG